MAYQLWSQDNFSKGELSPYMYARGQVQQYYDGLKTAQNVLTYPTGAAGKRFGTLFMAELSGITSYSDLFFQTFQYLDECVYQIVMTPLNIAIYLEGTLQANVVTTLDAESVYNLSNTILGSSFRVAGRGFRPLDLKRFPNGAETITSILNNEFVLGGIPLSAGVFPARFETSVTLPTTSPQIKVGITYFIATTIAGTSFSVYSSSYNAKYNIDPFTLTSIGTGNTVSTQNAWTFTNAVFKNLPIYDFDGGYDAITFTPSATTGAAVTLTASSSIFTAAHIGGAFIGAGGTSRITAVASGVSATIAVQDPFDSTNPIQGSLSLLAEPAWSDARGWPQKCSSYQNRALFANTESLPNGFYTSVVNDYSDFGDLTTDDDDAISWYPSSNDVNVIRFIVPYRSITVHTNSGIYSSPLSEISAITPKTFSLQLQDSTPADVLLPQAIDNQIIVISGNDVHTMLWDGINNAYTSNIVSIINEQTIRDPRDETAFADLTRAGSRYVFIINANGSMAVYQTLQAESVSGFTPQIMEQSYGSAQFLQVASSSDGRAWFVCQREQATAGAPSAISSFGGAGNIQLVVSNSLSTTIPTAITFTTTGSLPVTVPALSVSTYYWALAITGNAIVVYQSQSDALANFNAFVYSSAGVNSNIVPWPLAPIFTLEELSQDVHLDCAVYYNGPPASTIPVGTIFNAQKVKMVGDGFGFEDTAIGSAVTFEAHGSPVEVSEAYIGFPIRTIMEPMPIALPQGQQNGLTRPTHIRTVNFMFNNTIGGTINGVPIALEPFSAANIGQPPFPARGVFEMSIMKGWSDFNNPTFTIEHDEPFNIELIGAFYAVEI